MVLSKSLKGTNPTGTGNTSHDEPIKYLVGSTIQTHHKRNTNLYPNSQGLPSGTLVRVRGVECGVHVGLLFGIATTII